MTGGQLSTLWERKWDASFWRTTAIPYAKSAISSKLFDKYVQYRYGQSKERVVDREWDVLVILDACRYDAFERESSLPGRLEARFSPAGTTGEFVNRNFTDSKHYDTVYVTANPWVNQLADGQFHEIVPTWKTRWDDDLNTVPPEAMAEATIEAANQYPAKRIISHFVQPHEPFLVDETDGHDASASGIAGAKQYVSGELESPQTVGETIMAKYRRGELSRRVAWEMYVENLRLTLPHVRTILDEIPAKTAVTADHGEMFGEWGITPLPRRYVGHTSDIQSISLLKVPWLVREGPEREVVAERPEAPHDTGSDDLEEKLSHLGYK